MSLSFLIIILALGAYFAALGLAALARRSFDAWILRNAPPVKWHGAHVDNNGRRQV